jgi:inorganic triphosphatase YgiF
VTDAGGGGTGPRLVEREVERKYAVGEDFEMPDLTGAGRVALVEEPVTVTLSATYHDTPDLRLARNGISLRRRTGGADAGWHLKLPVDGAAAGVRDEVRLPLGRSAQGPPPRALTDLVTAYARSQPLAPVAQLRTRRTLRLLADASGAPLAELTDDRVSVLDGRAVTETFRELEVELRDGDDGDLDAVGEALRRAGATAGEFVSKSARALGPRAGGAPDVPPPREVKPQDSAGEALRAHVAAQVRAFQRWDLGVRRDEPDAVHQLRVAARRTRSALHAYRDLVEGDWARELRGELKWAAAALGRARDLEVLLRRFESGVGELPADVDRAPLLGGARTRLLGEGDAARAEALKALRTPRYTRLLDALVDAATQAPLTQVGDRRAGAVLPGLVAHSWDRLAEQVGRLEVDGPDEEWHAARKAAKRARYATELAVPVFGKPARRLARRIERVTELLGAHQDAAVAAGAYRSLAEAEGTSGAAGFALGVLHERERVTVAAARAQLADTWPGLSRRKWRAWLER